MFSIRELVTLSIRNHVWFLSVWIIVQFLVGSQTEVVSNILRVPVGTLVGLHKTSGQILVLFAIVLVIERAYMLAVKIPRPPIKNAFMNSSIRNHYIFYIILLPAQYLTTVMAGDVAKFLGLQQGTVFQAHGVIGFLLLLNSIVLLVEKLLLPSAIRGSDSKKV